jgi:hypothetical protein
MRRALWRAREGPETQTAQATPPIPHTTTHPSLLVIHGLCACLCVRPCVFVCVARRVGAYPYHLYRLSIAVRRRYPVMQDLIDNRYLHFPYLLFTALLRK